MAKELPYFKFFPAEWLKGDITLCSNSAQGLFINICTYYWMKDCNMSLTSVEQRFNMSLIEIEELLNKGVISTDSDNNIIIQFMDEQFSEFDEIREKRSKAGRCSAKSRAGNKRATHVKQVLNNKDIDKDIDKDNKREYILSEFEVCFNRWLDYKRDRKESYKNEDSIKAAYNKLIKLSGNNPVMANEIIEQSLANNWAGLFELKDKLKKLNDYEV